MTEEGKCKRYKIHIAGIRAPTNWGQAAVPVSWRLEKYLLQGVV